MVCVTSVPSAASVDEQERLMLDLAAGNVSRVELTAWLTAHVRPRPV